LLYNLLILYICEIGLLTAATVLHDLGKCCIPDINHRTDGEIAAAAAHKIAWATTIPTETVQITVRNGWIILEGEAEWWYQKNAAEIVMRSISAVHGVSNSISIKPTDKIPAVGMDIEAAIDRNAMLDASKIRVEIVGSKVLNVKWLDVTRQLDGIHKAKELGVRFGRKQLLSASQIVELHLRRAQGTLIKILMKDFSLSKASVYRYLKKNASSGI
jgi:BON domain